MQTFRIGDRVETITHIVLPDVTIGVGTQGRIIDVDPEQPNEILFLPDDPPKALADWNYLVPADASQLQATV